MQLRTSVAVFAAAVLFSGAPLAAQSLSGSWTIESETPRGAQTLTLALAQAGSELSGTVSFSMGGRRGGGGGPRAFDIHDGNVDGNSFAFSITLNFNGNEITQRFSGTFEGDSMEGTIEGGRGGGRPFRGMRAG